MSNYRIFLREEPEGGFTVTVPLLPGCISYGETTEIALNMAKEAIELYIASCRSQGQDVPNENGFLQYTITVND